MTLQELTADNYLTLPQIPRADVTFLWHCDFWDGPQTGIVRWGSERLWFEMFPASVTGSLNVTSWRFLLVRLSEQQLRDEEWWHELFRQHVGTHTDYERADGDPGTVHPREQHAKFYDAYATRVPPDLSANEVIGWFEM
jgi:hypothetical protein